MKLFTKAIDDKLFKQYPMGSDLEKQMVVTKIFNPYGNTRWYLLNSDPEDPDYIWAIVQMNDIIEVGSVSRSELERIRVKPWGLPLERDLSFIMVNAKELYDGLREGKFYKRGGWVENDENKDMLLNYAEEFEHHTEEFEEAAKKAKHVPAWVVAKSERASTDLSDVTHYLDSENEREREEMEGEEMEKGGITGDLHSLTDKMLSKKIQTFLAEVKPIKYYYIDEENNMLVVGFDQYYTQDAADKFYKAAISSTDFFDAGSVDMEYDSKTKDTKYFIKLKRDAKFNKGGEMAKGGEITIKVGDKVKSKKGVEGEVYETTGTMFKLKDKYGGKSTKWYSVKDFKPSEINSMAKGGKTTFSEKVSAVKKSHLERKKVAPQVQKDYGKTYSPKEAEESAKRIVGAMTARERLMNKIKDKRRKKK